MMAAASVRDAFNELSSTKYKELVKLIIKWVKEGKEVEFQNFPYNLQRIIKGSEEILYLLKFFQL